MIKIKQVNIEGTKFIAPTWEQMGKLIFDLGKQIIKSGQKYSWLISIAKGGWTWSRTLADYLSMDNMASVKAKLYQGVGQTAETLTLEQILPEGVDIKDKKLLLFDDVADSGKTLAAVRDYLLNSGAKSVETATLFFKPHSVLIPNFYSFKTQAWIIFPHEIREFINLTFPKWVKATLGKKEVINLYKKLGLSNEQVRFFISLLDK